MTADVERLRRISADEELKAKILAGTVEVHITSTISLDDFHEAALATGFQITEVKPGEKLFDLITEDSGKRSIEEVTVERGQVGLYIKCPEGSTDTALFWDKFSEYSEPESEDELITEARTPLEQLPTKQTQKRKRQISNQEHRVNLIPAYAIMAMLAFSGVVIAVDMGENLKQENYLAAGADTFFALVALDGIKRALDIILPRNNNPFINTSEPHSK